jgi:hypothetical protein
VFGLDWPDCELVRGRRDQGAPQWTRPRELAPPKAGSRRVVPISDKLVLYLLELKMRSADKSGPVFASSRVGGRLSHRNIQRRGFEPAALAAGLEGVTLHSVPKPAPKPSNQRDLQTPLREKPALRVGFSHGRGWVRTSDLPRVKRALSR